VAFKWRAFCYRRPQHQLQPRASQGEFAEVKAAAKCWKKHGRTRPRRRADRMNVMSAFGDKADIT
jgi:hypothetical protein